MHQIFAESSRAIGKNQKQESVKISLIRVAEGTPLAIRVPFLFLW
jgi:hypothetical protein